MMNSARFAEAWPTLVVVRLNKLRSSLVLIMCAQLVACAGLRDGTASVWPDNIPPRSYFVTVYEEDEPLHALQSQQEYLYWVRKFYEGTTLYPRGWNDLTEELLAGMEDPEEALQRKERLYRLGRDIAAEWSKVSSVNRVDNHHLAVWGVAAGRSVDEENVDETLSKIIADVQKLMALEIRPEAITPDRYHPQDPDDWFAL